MMRILPLLLLAIGLAAAEPAAANGLDAIDAARAMREPAWGLQAMIAVDPAFAAAIAAGTAGDPAPITAWTRAAALPHLALATQVVMDQSELPGAEAAIAGLHALFEGMLAGMPEAAEAQRLAMANHLAYSLVGRTTPPTAAELARAGVLADGLERDLQRPEVAHGRNGHGIADTVACVRFLQGDRAKAAGLWRTANELAGPRGSSLYRRRLAAAEGQAPIAALPR